MVSPTWWTWVWVGCGSWWWIGKPSVLHSMGSERVGHDWTTDWEGNGNPLQCSCLENPRDRGAWWAAVYGVAQGQTRLKWLSSSSSSRATELNWTKLSSSHWWPVLSVLSTAFPSSILTAVAFLLAYYLTWLFGEDFLLSDYSEMIVLLSEKKCFCILIRGLLDFISHCL